MSDIPYAAEDPLQSFDYYQPPDYHPAPLLVFVHGGAWRSSVVLSSSSSHHSPFFHSEDKADHAALARSLAAATHCPVAVPNYRLTSPATPHQHPVHARDILSFLHFLVHKYSPPSAIYLIGHSCSAHMLASIFLAPSCPPDTLTPSPDLLRAVKGFVLSEGIYDVDLLLQSFPSYKQWFIAHTFGDRPSYPEVNVAAYALRPGGDHARWLVVHNKNDPLVDLVQSETFFAHLARLHAREDAKGVVTSDFTTLTPNGHNDIFKEDAYVDLVAQFVKAAQA
ncbi:hypothetical protein EUX98_g7238 [Antrodiella citrinella]|uniref:Uncharacterized protein n=1 Tax=Antrodiella citrinella TaxID=2447956 RepID=A0A4S4MMB3_9APHY|nr:hypothetical protein EUX98_g7238 [Antrodiella citrinella]